MKRITVDLDDEAYEQFRVATVLSHTTMTRVLRDAVDAYLAEHAPQPQQQRET